jgi:hypothetical protein
VVRNLALPIQVMHLLFESKSRSPANVAYLNKSIEQYNAGKTTGKDLLE